MPVNYHHGESNNANIIYTFDQVVNTMRHSSNKHDAIRTIQNTQIQGTNTKIGTQYAHALYDRYVEYNGYECGRHR